MFPTRLWLTTASGCHSLDLCLANTFFSRLRGLILAPKLQPGQGMLLTGCTSVHTVFMQQAIDLVYLDEKGLVVCCAADVPPWRAGKSCMPSVTARRRRTIRHTLELAAGSIDRFQILPGDQLQHPLLAARIALAPVNNAAQADEPSQGTGMAPMRQRGSAMIEFAIVGPIITLLGMALLQYGLLFFEKNQVNHATFMAARAGSTGNARFATMQEAYAKAMVPIFATDTTPAALALAFGKAMVDVRLHTRIELLNPTAQSFADFNDTELQAKLGDSRHRVIPNGGQSLRRTRIVNGHSGQNIQDANLLKIRVTQGYEAIVPLIGPMYLKYLQLTDDGRDRFRTVMIATGRIPVVSHVTLQMQSDAIEEPAHVISNPGNGNRTVPSRTTTPPSPAAPPPVSESTPSDCPGSECLLQQNTASSAGGTASSAGETVSSAGDTEPERGDGQPGGRCEMPIDAVA